MFEINQLTGFFDTGSFLSVVEKYTDIPRFGLKPAGLGWAVLLLVCAWPSGIVGVSSAPQKLPLGQGAHFKNMETIQTNLVTDVRQRVAEVVVGQDTVVERLLIALFTGGHLLVWRH